VYNPDSAGKDRNRLSRSIVLALRELMKQPDTNPETLDLTAYITLALSEISQTIDVSVQAWEKRGYWVKADKFRLEWEWAELYSRQMSNALKEQNWAQVAATSVKIAQKFNKVTVPERHHLGKPWLGAWEEFNKA
jgi:hypothetical protein